jgi:hypothetical protein
MAGTKLDGAGAAKMKTIEEALSTIQSIHGMVERMAIDIKNQRGIGVIPGQIKRTATPLIGQLKGQFGLIADQVTGMVLGMGRGGGELNKLRGLRENVALIRQALEITAAKVKKDHAVDIEIAPD